MTQPEQRKWFGPKRTGYGFQPQTWQGWLITTIAALVVAGIIIVAVR